jgi:hypothetical protein
MSLADPRGSVPRMSWLLAAAAAVALFAPAAASACRCVARSPAALTSASDIIVVADVLGIADAGLYRSYQLRVVKSWKQGLPDRMVVRSECTDCMARFAKGGRYLIYLSRSKKGFETDACSGNLPISQAATTITALGRSARSRR